MKRSVHNKFCLCLLLGTEAVDKNFLDQVVISTPSSTSLHLLMIVPHRNVSSIDYLQDLISRYDAEIGELLQFNEGMTFFDQWEAGELPRNDNWLYDVPHAMVTVVSLAIARLEALGYQQLYLPLRSGGLNRVTENIGNFLYCLNQLADKGTSFDFRPILRYPLLEERPVCPLEETVLENHTAIKFKQKSVVLFSGGLDCTVAAYIMQKLGYSLQLYNVQYGQSNRYQEKYCIKKTVERLSNDGDVILTELYAPIFQLIGGSALIDDSIMITQNNTNAEYVPFRNTILINFAILYALRQGISHIVTGAHQDDTLAPDNQLSYFHAFQMLLKSMRATAHIHLLPILLWIGGKPEIIWVGNKLGVDFRYCWSCHNYVGERQAGNSAIACGLCGNCSTRYHAFIKAGLEDPLLYDVKPAPRLSWHGWSKQSREILDLMGLSLPET